MRRGVTRMRGHTRAWLALAFVLVGALGITGTATADDPVGHSGPPWIASDQADYAPGAAVTLNGGNWAAGEVVHINVNDNQGRAGRATSSDGRRGRKHHGLLQPAGLVRRDVHGQGDRREWRDCGFHAHDAINVSAKGKDDAEHLTLPTEEALGSVGQSAGAVSLTCPRGTGLTVRATGLGGSQTSAWSLAFFAGVGDNATMSPATTLSPNSGTFGSGSGGKQRILRRDGDQHHDDRGRYVPRATAPDGGCRKRSDCTTSGSR